MMLSASAALSHDPEPASGLQIGGQERTEGVLMSAWNADAVVPVGTIGVTPLVMDAGDTLVTAATAGSIDCRSKLPWHRSDRHVPPLRLTDLRSALIPPSTR